MPVSYLKISYFPLHIYLTNIPSELRTICTNLTTCQLQGKKNDKKQNILFRLNIPEVQGRHLSSRLVDIYNCSWTGRKKLKTEKRKIDHYCDCVWAKYIHCGQVKRMSSQIQLVDNEIKIIVKHGHWIPGSC